MKQAIALCLFVCCMAAQSLQAQVLLRDSFPLGIDTVNMDDDIATVTLQTDDDENSGAGQEGGNFSGLLNSGRDPFFQAITFAFFPARFRARGYDNALTAQYVNGLPMNDLKEDRTDFRDWRGLNDLTRQRQFSYALTPNDVSFGNLGGTNNIDMRASEQRRGTRISYALTNRSYRNRTMITHSSGMQDNGWAYTISGSHSWAQEGFVEGTFFDGYAYALSVDKKLNRKHSFNFVGLGSPAKVGRSAPTFDYMYDVANSKNYNFLWGYQEGKKRNSRVDNVHQPILMLRHDFTPSDKTHITTAVSYQFGRTGRTNLEWFEAQDPRPDYYLKLPFTMTPGAEQTEQVQALLENDVNARQLNWTEFYNTNRANVETVTNFDGTSVTGARAQYFVGENRTDTREANANATLRHNLTNAITLNAGLSYQYYKGFNFQTIDDLLGAAYYVDLNKFSVRDFASDTTAQQNDLDEPNKVLRVGDRYGYDYEAHVRRTTTWGQISGRMAKIDYFLAGSAATTSYWRVGNRKVGLFPETSLGKSDVQNFIHGGLKGGLTYKFTGRHLVYGSGMYQTLPPQFRDAYLSPRTREQVAPNLKNSSSYSGEFGYIFRAPKLVGRISTYYTQISNQTETRAFFSDFDQSFVNYNLQGLDQLHRGLEFAAQYKISPSFNIRGVAVYSRNIFTSRPVATVTLDNSAELLETQTVYLKNFYVANTPQQAYNAQLGYNNSKIGFINLAVNYFSDSWSDLNYVRRTSRGLGAALPGSEEWDKIIRQERLPDAMTVDIFAGRTIFLKNRDLIGINIGVNNILNNQFKVGGFEVFRTDVSANQNLDRFPTKYSYSQGINYFINLSYTLN